MIWIGRCGFPEMGDPNIAPTGHLLLWETNGLRLSHVVHGHFGKVLDASMYGTRSPQNRVFQRVSQLNSFCCCCFFPHEPRNQRRGTWLWHVMVNYKANDWFGSSTYIIIVSLQVSACVCMYIYIIYIYIHIHMLAFPKIISASWHQGISGYLRFGLFLGV